MFFLQDPCDGILSLDSESLSMDFCLWKQNFVEQWKMRTPVYGDLWLFCHKHLLTVADYSLQGRDDILP